MNYLVSAPMPVPVSFHVQSDWDEALFLFVIICVVIAGFSFFLSWFK